MTDGGRKKSIITTSIIVVISNVLLAGFKATVGFLSNSISIVLDAVNNLSDAMSSVITIIGARLAGKPADKNHPYGHGRYEFISSAVISVLVLYAGITAFSESINAILNPSEPDYSTAALIVVSVAIVAKIVLGLFLRKQGEKYNSDSLKNSGQDSMMDSIISGATLLAAIIFIVFGVSLEAYLGVIISLFIIKSGYDMLRGAVSKILGERVDSELSQKVKTVICETEGVEGAYDLIMNSYGPERWLASVHIEVPDVWDAEKIDTVSRDITHRVAKETGVIITAVGVYSRNTTNDEVKIMRTKITETVMQEEYVLQMHGFYCDTKEKRIRFDVVTDFDAQEPMKVIDKVSEKVKAMYPEYDVFVQPDLDVSD